jgi:prepilin-type processing-associated H-X9-DG protein
VVADQVAYDERPYKHHPRLAPVIEPLRRCLRPLECAYQLIHGDFGGNVLFADGLPPAIIDFSPYWRSPELALGVVVADAIVWEGADLSLIEACSQVPDFVQHLARAELRRLIELETLHDLYGWEVLDEIDAHLPLVREIVALSTNRSG